MAWLVQPLEIADETGSPTGRWRMTATSDEGGGGPHGDTSHDHASAEEAMACEQCEQFCDRVTGFPRGSMRRAGAGQTRHGIEHQVERLKNALEEHRQAGEVSKFMPFGAVLASDLRAIVSHLDAQAAEIERLRADLDGLVMLVGMKYPGESRYETAARYIRQAESSCGGEANEVRKA